MNIAEDFKLAAKELREETTEINKTNHDKKADLDFNDEIKRIEREYSAL